MTDPVSPYAWHPFPSSLPSSLLLLRNSLAFLACDDRSRGHLTVLSIWRQSPASLGGGMITHMTGRKRCQRIHRSEAFCATFFFIFFKTYC